MEGGENLPTVSREETGEVGDRCDEGDGEIDNRLGKGGRS